MDTYLRLLVLCRVEGCHVGDVLDVWTNEVVQRVRVRGGGRLVREGYKVVALLLKPRLGLFGLVGRRRVPLPHQGYLIAPGDHHTLQHIQVHFGVDFQADFEDVRLHDVALTWKHTKDHNRSRKLFFHHSGPFEPSGFAFWGWWEWSCCHNLDR